MKLLLPPKRVRIQIVKRLHKFFTTQNEALFQTAIHKLCEFYQIPLPSIYFVTKLDNGYAGLTTDRGVISLYNVDTWKANRVYNSKEQWVDTALHEMAHYIFWCRREETAIQFAKEMMECKTSLDTL